MLKKKIKFISYSLAFVLAGFAYLFFIVGGGFGERPAEPVLLNNKSLIFPHGGLKVYYTANSLIGLKKCQDFGFNAVETDIHPTKDNKLIIFHNTTCIESLGINGNIYDFTYDQIKDLPLLNNDTVTPNKIVTFDKLLSTLGDSIIIYLDIKTSSKTVADSVLATIQKHELYNTVLVADENIKLLVYLKLKDPKIKTILESFSPKIEWVERTLPINLKPDFYSSKLGKVSKKHIAFLEEHNILDRRIVWDVTKETLKDVCNFGIQNIIYNYDSLEIKRNILEKQLIKHKRK